MKASLKILGTEAAAYFTDGSYTVYPENPNTMDLSVDILSFHHSNSGNALPQGWQFPDTWSEFNNSEAAFLFLRRPREEFEGSSTKALFIAKRTSGFKGGYIAVFEDCHVETLTKFEAEVYWAKAVME